MKNPLENRRESDIANLRIDADGHLSYQSGKRKFSSRNLAPDVVSDKAFLPKITKKSINQMLDALEDMGHFRDFAGKRKTETEVRGSLRESLEYVQQLSKNDDLEREAKPVQVMCLVPLIAQFFFGEVANKKDGLPEQEYGELQGIVRYLFVRHSRPMLDGFMRHFPDEGHNYWDDSKSGLGEMVSGNSFVPPEDILGKIEGYVKKHSDAKDWADIALLEHVGMSIYLLVQLSRQFGVYKPMDANFMRYA